ncbi:MAG: hypothetical protein HYZ11_16975 [Candidatus Tectomicrobia bacterium]|uniref:Uncharacterized protein n=1 Tax=Tectimicrobiota bacterium TaxID=2528274 RepID=A0A932I530_UNCTE|nr:hypothetical protein [Candidatus Tectomicrobia bacterium]
MRKRGRLVGVSARHLPGGALILAALALGLLLPGCARPYNGYSYTPSYSSSSEAKKEEPPKEEEKERKHRHYGYHSHRPSGSSGWRGGTSSGSHSYRGGHGHSSGGGGGYRGKRSWRSK